MKCTIKRYGATRGTLVDGGVDMNRSFQYKDASGNIRFDSVMNDSRNYTGPEANWCIESEALKSFIDSHKSETGINIFVDTHGYTNQILISQDTNQLYDFFHKQFTGGLYETIYHNGAGYVARYAHDFQGMDGCLFEFPANCTSEGALFTNGYHTLYINVIADILKNYPT